MIRIIIFCFLFLFLNNSYSKTVDDFPILTAFLDGTGQQGLFYYYLCDEIEREYSEVPPKEIYEESIALLKSDEREMQTKGILMKYYSARMGFSEAQFEISSDFYKTEKYNHFIFWLEEASKNGHPIATFNLGVMYQKGFAGKNYDIKKAKELYSKSCEMGYENACKFI